jgi:predicted AAA+ superfamily ATPase
MWIKRDFLDNWTVSDALEAVLLLGPRQIGKTSVLLKMSPEPNTEIYLDDPTLQATTKKDPEFILANARLPVLIDEIQRAPEILLSIKKNIDAQRRMRLKNGTATHCAGFRMTGSNQSELDQLMKETLAGRISIRRLHGLSTNELWRHKSEISLNEILFRGGFPELWVRADLNPIPFLNDYISTFIEKDIARSAGVEKISHFITTLRLLAARAGELLNYESLSKDAGVSGNAIKDWVSLLERNSILFILRPYHSNLNKRIIKMPKVYFIDSGLCVRLQGHQDMATVLHTPQAGHLFENLVVAEVIKTRDHFRQDWQIHFWRTKEKVEIDIIIESSSTLLLIEVKLGSAAQAYDFPTPATLAASGKRICRAIVIANGEKSKLTKDLDIVPIAHFGEYLIEQVGQKDG